MALIVGASLLMAGGVWAADAVGGQELKMLTLILTSNYGIALGLGAAIWGIYQFSQNNTGLGLTLVIAGVLITLSPGIFNGTRAIVCGVSSLLVAGVNSDGC